MAQRKQPQPVRYLEFCYAPASRGYFIWEWTGNPNIMGYTWHKITMFNEVYAIRDNQELDEAVSILRHYLASEDYGLVSRYRLD